MQKVARFVLAVLATSVLSANAEILVALTSTKKLQFFDHTFPLSILKTVDITGIPTAELGVALDFRTNGGLIVVTREGTTLRTYKVNPDTGAAVNATFTEVAPTAAGVAFDAMPDAAENPELLLTTEADDLRRFTLPPTGSPISTSTKTLAFDNDATDGDPVDEHAGADPAIVALASTNGFRGARATVVYGIEAIENTLVKIDYNTGSIDTVAVLHRANGSIVRVSVRTGLDISGLFGTAYLMFGLSDSATLMSVNLNTGVATDLGSIGPEGPEANILVDIAAIPPTDLVNIATRSRVGAGEDVMIAGFISQGTASNRFLIRARGPSLTPLGVNGALADPVLTIFDANGPIATNDNWKSTQQSEIQGTGIPPSNDLEAAFFGAFPPGQYTAIISGKDGSTGVGLIEIFKLPDL